MVTLVTSGHLLAPGGSAELIVGGIKIMRTRIGSVIKAVLDKKEGRQVLADAIKRIRAGLSPRWWADGGLIERDDWKGSDFNAHLRLAANHGFDPEDYRNNPTATEREEKALTIFQTSLTTAAAHLDDLISMRKENGTTNMLPWTVMEPSFKQLNFMDKDLARISDDEPR